MASARRCGSPALVAHRSQSPCQGRSRSQAESRQHGTPARSCREPKTRAPAGSGRRAVVLHTCIVNMDRCPRCPRRILHTGGCASWRPAPTLRCALSRSTARPMLLRPPRPRTPYALRPRPSVSHSDLAPACPIHPARLLHLLLTHAATRAALYPCTHPRAARVARVARSHRSHRSRGHRQHRSSSRAPTRSCTDAHIAVLSFSSHD